MYTNTGTTACVSLGGDAVSTVKSYHVTRKTSTPATAVTSNSKAGTLSVPGQLDWSGGFVSMALEPSVIPGAQVAFVGCQGGSGVTQSGNVIITSLATTIDIKAGAPIEWTCEFSGDGEMTESTGTLADTSPPEVVTPIGATFSVTKNGSTSVTTTSWQLASIALNISSAVSGGGATSSSGGWLKRLGGAINFTYDMTFENDRIADLNFDVGDDLAITITLSNTKTIVIKWVQITGFGDATLDNSSAEPITLPVSGVMNAYSQSGTAYGLITIGDTQLWPSTT